MSITSDAAKIAADADLFHQIVHGPSTGPDVTTEGGNVSPLAKVLAKLNDNIMDVDAYGAVGDGVTDDTAAVDAAIAACPPGGTVTFSGEKHYVLRSLARITKAITINGGGCRVTADVTDSGATGHPLFCFYGAKTLPYACDAAAEGEDFLVVSTPADADHFEAGDMVMIYSTDPVPYWWGSGVSVVEKQEVNFVASISGDQINLIYPLSNAMTAVTISRVDPVDGAALRNFGSITETYSGSPGTSGHGPDSPNIVDLMYCRNCTIEDIGIDGYEMMAVSLAYCDSVWVRQVAAKNAFNPGSGGLGAVVKPVTCRRVVISRCRGENVRHLVDWVGCLDCTSEFNVCTQDPAAAGTTAAYLTHGWLSKRIASYLDTAINATGWYVGNSDFATDRDVQIIGFRHQALNPAMVPGPIGINIWNGASKVEIVSPDIESRNDCIHIGGMADHINIRGGILRNRHPDSFAAIGIWDDDTYAGNIFIDGVNMSSNFQGVYAEFVNALTIRNCIISAAAPISVSNAVAGRDLIISQNIITRIDDSGDYAIGVSIGPSSNYPPTKAYRVEFNHINGQATPAAIAVRNAANMILRGNRAPGNSNPVSLLGTVTKNDVSTGGGRIEDNNDDPDDAYPTAIGVNGPSSINRFIQWMNNGVQRWALACGTSAGGEAFQLSAYDDDGSWIDTPLSIIRAAGGLATMSRTLRTTAARRIKALSVTSAASTTVIGTSEHCVIVTGTTTHTLTLPTGDDGRILIIKNRSTGTVTVNRAGSNTIDGGTTFSLTAGQGTMLVFNGTDWCRVANA